MALEIGYRYSPKGDSQASLAIVRGMVEASKVAHDCWYQIYCPALARCVINRVGEYLKSTLSEDTDSTRHVHG